MNIDKLKKRGVRELTLKEKREINGGGILPILFALAVYVGYKRAEAADK